jgi:hypothetical protein
MTSSTHSNPCARLIEETKKNRDEKNKGGLRLEKQNKIEMRKRKKD